MSEQSNKTKIVQARLTPEEYRQLQRKFAKTTCHKLSDFVRRALLDKPVTVKMRNQSLDDFMAEMIALRHELNAIGSNYNQLIKRLHTLRENTELKKWLLLHESAREILLQKTEQIKTKINSINDLWLQ